MVIQGLIFMKNSSPLHVEVFSIQYTTIETITKGTIAVRVEHSILKWKQNLALRNPGDEVSPPSAISPFRENASPLI